MNNVLSFAVVTLLFAAIYKVLPDAEIRWSDVWIGAVVTSVLFVIGKAVIGLYLGHASVGSTYGAAGSLLVFLVWVYYAAQILFFGAEFTQVYARTRGSRIVPSADAEPLTAEARGEQGMAAREDPPHRRHQAGALSDRRPAPVHGAGWMPPRRDAMAGGTLVRSRSCSGRRCSGGSVAITVSSRLK